MAILDSVHFCLAKGWWVFPLLPKSKLPNARFVAQGVKNASNDPKQIAEWWKSEPEGNFGIALGPSKLVVLDVDSGLNNLDEARRWATHNQVPHTFIVRTGRRSSFGIQFYFTGCVPNKPYEFQGVTGEVRSAGYYVVGPGSIHPDSGQPYSVLRDAAPAQVPSFIFNLANRKVPRPIGDETEKVSPSFRHYYLMERARELHFAGLDGAGLEAAITSLYFTRCERDSAKDGRIGREAGEIVQWIHDHPAVYPLQPNDFRTLRHAEKDPKVKLAFSGQLDLFDGSPEAAFQYLVTGLRTLGANVDQIKRIVAISNLSVLLEPPSYITEEKAGL